jgi:phosphoglycerate dehydrogenase-like enzyme
VAGGSALVPQMLAGVPASVPLVVYQDLSSLGGAQPSDIGFVVPPYMGPAAELGVLSHLPNLKVCQLLTAGYDQALAHLPSGITVCNAAGVHDASTAELTIGLILASQRGIDDFSRGMHNGRWLHATRPSLADRRVLIIGAGGLGRAIQRRLEPFEVEVQMVARTQRPDVHDATQVPHLLGWADIVVLAVPLTEQTRGMVDAGFLSQMKAGALLVNVSRGAVVHTPALMEFVAAGKVRAALDVTDPEPLPAEHPLWQLPGVLISPHVGGNSDAFIPRANALVAEQLHRWSLGEPLRNVVSAP